MRTQTAAKQQTGDDSVRLPGAGESVQQRTRLIRSPQGGYSLIELIVTVAIIAILIAITVPAVSSARSTARSVQCRNNLRNVSLALVQFEVAHRRLPASGNYYDAAGVLASHHSWAVSILPWVEQRPLYDAWNLDLPITDPVNRPLANALVPVYVCPDDISTAGRGDLSYVVNGGVGFTLRLPGGVGDCPVHPGGPVLDLNANGQTCPADPALDGSPSDRDLFKHMGLFFLENWNCEGTVRHYALADVKDGVSQTFLASENVRAGFDPQDAQSGFANPDPYRCAFYVGNPCPTGSCSAGDVDYSLSNSGAARINSGLWKPEGFSPVPNSFHTGGVHVSFADGRVTFLSESIDGAVYAALSSANGLLLRDTPLAQVIVSGDSY